MTEISNDVWPIPPPGFHKRQSLADLISVFRSLISGRRRRLRIPSAERGLQARPAPLGLVAQLVRARA